jgi:hypothetical protein
MSEQDKNYPEMQQMIKNFAHFAKDVAQNPKFVSIETFAERMNICRACDYFDPVSIRCKRCGCMLRGKAKFKAGKCPIKKW